MVFNTIQEQNDVHIYQGLTKADRYTRSEEAESAYNSKRIE